MDTSVGAKKITQYYLTDKDSKSTERVRETITTIKPLVWDFKYYHTIKTPVEGSWSCYEDEKEITLDEFESHTDNAKRVISKDRFHFEDNENGLVWEIDRFVGINLIIAEVELPSEEFELIIPEKLEKYILMEITGVKELSNSSLSESINGK